MRIVGPVRDRGDGDYEVPVTWVYGRRGKPCRRCGTPIRSAGRDDRVTFWCSSGQPG
jgi:formamidopyrimidine-DNA glycosylase